MAQMLDRSRPFAEVHGISDVRYEQDYLCFDYEGRLIAPVEQEEEAPKKRGRPRKQSEGEQ